MQEKALLPFSPTDCLNHPQTSRASFQCARVGFSIKKKKKRPKNNKNKTKTKKKNHHAHTHITKNHTFVKAEMFQGAASFRQTFAKSWADFWWQPARFPNPSPSRQPPNPGSQDTSRLPGLKTPQHGQQISLSLLWWEDMDSRHRFAQDPALQESHASPHGSRLFPDVSCLLEAAPAALWSWGSEGSVN